MPLKPSANSDTRHDATNSPAAINLNRAKYPPPLSAGMIIMMIFGIFSSLDTDFDTHDLWNEMNEIKEALARERVLLDSKLSQV